jgi:hypothetical protein
LGNFAAQLTVGVGSLLPQRSGLWVHGAQSIGLATNRGAASQHSGRKKCCKTFRVIFSFLGVEALHTPRCLQRTLGTHDTVKHLKTKTLGRQKGIFYISPTKSKLEHCYPQINETKFKSKFERNLRFCITTFMEMILQSSCVKCIK